MKEFNIYKCKLVKESQVEYTGRINCPDDVFSAAIKMGFNENAEEVFGIFATDTKGLITSYHEVSRGSLDSAYVHPREIFKRAIAGNSSAILLVHNHPSGDPTPSPEDKATTRRLIEAGEILGIPVIDHIIVGSEADYYSLKSYDEELWRQEKC